MRAPLVAVLVLVASLSEARDPKPKFTGRVSPPMALANVAIGGAFVDVWFRIVGSEVESWYCPRLVVEWPDDTRTMQESDCPPFEERDQCYPKLPEKCAPGWHRDRNGNIVDNETQAGCECAVMGYPRTWRFNHGFPPGEWLVKACISKAGKPLACETVVVRVVGG